MIATPHASGYRSLPRKKRPPTTRDKAIYLAYRTAGLTQTQLAKDYRLSQRRISEIIKRVERWRANLIPAAAGELEPRQSQRLERWIEQQRLQSIYDRAIRGYDSQSRELKTTRQGDRDGKPYRDETTRELPQNVQLLKVALRAAEDLGQLNDKPAAAAPDPQNTRQRYWKAHALICELRRDAGFGKDEDADFADSAAIAQALDILIGKQSAAPDRGAGVSPVPKTCSASEEVEDVDVGCISAAQCTTAENENAAEKDTDAQNCKPRISSLKPSNRSNSACPVPSQSPTPLTSTTADPLTNSDVEPTTLDDPRPPPQKNITAENPTPAERRRLHQQKLAQLAEARYLGFPCLIEFDPADGPLPLTYYQLDGSGSRFAPG